MIRRALSKISRWLDLSLQTQCLVDLPRGNTLHEDDPQPLTRWRHGRAWLRRHGFRADSTELRVEWNLVHGEARASVHLRRGEAASGDSPQAVAFSVGLPLLGEVYVTLEGALIPEQPAGDHEIAWHNGELWIHPARRTDGSWRRDDPWWQRGVHLNPLDVLGPEHLKTRKRFVEQVTIPMPEGNYTARLSKIKYTRQRWHWKRTHAKWDLDEIVPLGAMRCGCRETGVLTDPDCDQCGGVGEGPPFQANGVPIPGKDSAPWNCEIGATWSVSYPDSPRLKTPQDVVGRFVGDTLRTRQKRGGGLWWPPLGQRAQTA